MRGERDKRTGREKERKEEREKERDKGREIVFSLRFGEFIQLFKLTISESGKIRITCQNIYEYLCIDISIRRYY